VEDHAHHHGLCGGKENQKQEQADDGDHDAENGVAGIMLEKAAAKLLRDGPAKT
jgi:hypothetical protein